MSRVFISCPPFIQQKDVFIPLFEELGIFPTWANTVQQMTENDLIEILPHFDGWILGDDPCSRKVLQAGKSGALKAVVKWGVGTDNIDFAALKDLNINFKNTPGVFGKEVADLAFAYLIMLSRHVIKIHNHVLLGEWIKPPGISLSGKNVALIGYGDIGKNLSKHLLSAEMNIHVYEVDDTRTTGLSDNSLRVWPESISEMDAIILACALTPENSEMINKEILSNLKEGALIVNVSRGGLVNEGDLVEALNSGRLGGVALDVFQVEPLPLSSRLRKFENVILGTHNASNTSEAVIRTSLLSIDIMNEFLRKFY